MTTIGDWAFYDNSLTELVIGNSVTTIGQGAFQYNSLTELVIGNSVTTIGDWAFYDNSLTELVIGNSVTTIGQGAFMLNGIARAILPADMDVDERYPALGNYDLRDFYYNNGRASGDYTYDLSTETWSFEPTADPFSGGGEAKIHINPHGGGKKIVHGGGEAPVRVSTSIAGSGKRIARGGSEASISVRATTSSKKKMVGGGKTHIAAQALGQGGRLLKGGGEVNVYVSVEGGGYDFSLPLEIGPDDRWSYELAEADIEITGIAYRTVIEGEDGADDEEVDYLAGTDDYALVIEDNPLLQENFEAVLSALLAKIGGFTYRPLKFETIGYPHLWPGDRITKVIDAEGGEHTSIITNHLFTLNGKSLIEARGETETVKGYATGAPFTPRQKRVLRSVARIEAARQTSNLEQATLALNELMTNSLGYHTTTRTLETGAKITYTHDRPLLEESKIIWTRTEQGFAWTDEGWNDGDPVWQYGVTADGSIIAKLLDVIGIRAEWIQVGSAGDHIDGEIDNAVEAHNEDVHPHNLPLSITIGEHGILALKDSKIQFHLTDTGDAYFAGTVLGISGEFDWLRAGKTSGAHVELGAADGLPFLSMHDEEGDVITAITKQGIMIDPRGRINLPYRVSSNPDHAVIRTVDTTDRRYLMLRSGEGEESGSLIYLYNENDPTNPGQMRLYSGSSLALLLRADRSARFYGAVSVDGYFTAKSRLYADGNLYANSTAYLYGETVLDGELRMRDNRAMRFPYYGYNTSPAGVLRVVRTTGRRYMIWDSHDGGSGGKIYAYAGNDPTNPGQLRFYTAGTIALHIDKDQYARFRGDLRYDGGLYSGGTRGIPAADIRSGAVTSAKIGSGAVTTAKIASGAVTTAKIASGAVTSAKIASGAVTSAKTSGTTTGALKLREQATAYTVELTFTNGLLTKYSRYL